MKNGDFYKHYKGGEYFFDCIALPLEVSPFSKIAKEEKHTQTARHHENTQDLDLYLINGVTFIKSDVPHVIYQSEKDYNTNFVFAREVDDFFGYKHIIGSHYIKRFTLKD
jgi:hypothetical protein